MSEDQNKPLSQRRMHYGHPDMTSFQGYQHEEGTADPTGDTMVDRDNSVDTGPNLEENVTHTIHTTGDGTTSLKDVTNLQNIPYPVDIKRQDSFDEAIRYPALKQGLESPDIGTSKQTLVTPDEVFGPVSPRRSSSYHEESLYPPELTLSDSGQKALTEGSEPASRLVRYNSKKQKPSRNFASPEAPLSSQSRFEPVTVGAPSDRSSAGAIMTSTEEKPNSATAQESLERSRNEDKVENPGILSTTTVSIERNNFTNHPIVRDSKRRFMMSQLSNFSKGSSYDHGDYVDDNLLLSTTRLDSTLIRLFSDPNPKDKDYRQQNGSLSLPYVDYAQSDLISMDAVKWRVRPMEASQKETLDVELSFLEENVQARDIVKRLYQEDILTLMDYNQINRTEGQGDRAVTRLLVRTLQRRGHKAFPAFAKALSDTGYTHVVSRLTSTQQTIRAGMSKDLQLRQKNDHGTFVVVPAHSIPVLPIGSTPYEPTFLSLPEVSYRTTNSEDVGSIKNDTSRSSQPNGQVTAPNEELQQHLDDVKSELKALHDDVTALKTARQSSLATKDAVPTEEPSADDTTQTKKDTKDTAQKSSSCTIL